MIFDKKELTQRQQSADGIHLIFTFKELLLLCLNTQEERKKKQRNNNNNDLNRDGGDEDEAKSFIVCINQQFDT